MVQYFNRRGLLVTLLVLSTASFVCAMNEDNQRKPARHGMHKRKKTNEHKKKSRVTRLAAGSSVGETHSQDTASLGPDAASFNEAEESPESSLSETVRPWYAVPTYIVVMLASIYLASQQTLWCTEY